MPFVIWVTLGVIVAGLIAYRVVRKLRRSPAPQFIGRLLDSDLRRRIQSPLKIIDRSGIRPGMTVIELGCGSGAYTTHIARRVGEEGKVYAVDIQPGMLEQLKRKLSRAENVDIRNIELKLASAYALPFTSESIDLVCMVTVLHEVPDREKALREVIRVLRPGGTLAVSEMLLDPDYTLSAATIKICRGVGFRPVASSGNLWHYTVTFARPG